MKRARIVIASLAVVLLASGAWSGAAGQADITGGWIVTSWTTAAGVDSEPQRSLFLFTESGQYSMMFVLGDEARSEYAGDDLTDAEKLGAYDSFVANSGRYSVEGDQVTYEAYVAKDPNYMAAWGDNAGTMTFELEGETLTLSWPDAGGPFAGLSATLRRPGGD